MDQRTADAHVIRHVAEGRWPNVDKIMLAETVCRRLEVLAGYLRSQGLDP